MKACPKCYAPGLPDETYCDIDGEVLVDVRSCKCGRELREGARFCPNCGMPVPTREESDAKR